MHGSLTIFRSRNVEIKWQKRTIQNMMPFGDIIAVPGRNVSLDPRVLHGHEPTHPHPTPTPSPHLPPPQVLPSVLEHSGCSAALLVSVPDPGVSAMGAKGRAGSPGGSRREPDHCAQSCPLLRYGLGAHAFSSLSAALRKQLPIKRCSPVP